MEEEEDVFNLDIHEGGESSSRRPITQGPEKPTIEEQFIHLPEGFKKKINSLNAYIELLRRKGKSENTIAIFQELATKYGFSDGPNVAYELYGLICDKNSEESERIMNELYTNFGNPIFEKRFFESLVFDEEKTNYEINLEITRQKEESAKGIPCPVCSSENTTYRTKQVRAADEPATFFAHCSNCGHNWRFT